MAVDPKKHARVIDRVIDDLDGYVDDNIKALENRVAQLIESGVPPEQLRPAIIGEFKRTAVDLERDAGQQVKAISENTQQFSDIPPTPEDLTAESVLSQNAGIELGSSINSRAEDVVSTVVVASAAGVAGTLLANQARGRISGVFMESSDPDVKKAQRKLKNFTRRAKLIQVKLQKLQDRLEKD